VRKVVTGFGGRLVKTTGDGTLALLDGPASAVGCAGEPVLDATRMGIEMRAGVDTGECELIGDNIRGIAIHLGARIAALAKPDEVLVSATVKQLVAGSKLIFADGTVYTWSRASWEVATLQVAGRVSPVHPL
jgi:class 3 adenylate cyclase